MSQNRTVFPGVEGNDEPFNKGRQKQTHRRDNNSTVFPGMNANDENYRTVSKAKKQQHSKPIVGFVYSISRTGFGEYWPIYIGANTIGRSTKCNIVLSEGTVSEEHAVLVVRMMKNPQKLEASISDERSSHGTMLNDESISSVRPRECKNGDIITVGENYQLYLILVDTKALGLEVAENFIDVSSEDDDIDSGWGINTDEYPPIFNNGQPSDSASSGTVGLDNNSRNPAKGKTEW